MMEAQEAPADERARFAGARAEFVASLARRLSALRAALQAVEDQPESAARRDNLHRRLHAMGAAARVLGFDGIAEALARAEQGLQPPDVGAASPAAALSEVSRALDLVPALVWGSPRTVPPPQPMPDTTGEAARAWPLSVLVFGATPLADVLNTARDAHIECERTEDLAQARELARVLGPDVAIVDGDRRGGRELVEAMSQDPLVDPVPIIVVGSFDGPEAASPFVALGATRILPKPVSPDTLRRTVLELSQHGAPWQTETEPIGAVSVSALSERIAQEVQRGLVDALEPGSDIESVDLGHGAEVLGAVWGAVARVREFVTLRSDGKIRFDPGGPEGAIPVAPWLGGEREARRQQGAQRDVEAVTLAGRTLVVADDDPAVVWFISGLLRAVGAQVLEAHDGRAALELAHSGWPDVMVTDVLMPELDGFALCHEIKRDVAVRDVPVILLSWKEDLLQRVRELGANADGYLKKEASASQVVQRVREVLRPRARVEARIAAGGSVRGRLDGLTPRLILELACAKRKNARVTFRDAAFLYEVECREGAPRCATRTAADGGYQRGEIAISALLGVSAGRFVIADSGAHCRTEFSGSLRDVLSGSIARARAAQAALGPGVLASVDRVELDDAALADYLSSTPEAATELVRRLMDGAAPRELLLHGAGPRLLDNVLSDVARRGGVRRVVKRDGRILDLADVKPEPPHGESPRVPTPEPQPLFTFQLTPAAPEVANSEGWDLVDAAARELERSPLPLNSKLTPAAPPQVPSTPWPQQEAGTWPGVGKSVAEARAKPEPAEHDAPALDLGAAVADSVTHLSPTPGGRARPLAPTPSPTRLPVVRRVTEPPRPASKSHEIGHSHVEIESDDEALSATEARESEARDETERRDDEAHAENAAATETAHGADEADDEIVPGATDEADEEVVPGAEDEAHDELAQAFDFETPSETAADIAPQLVDDNEPRDALPPEKHIEFPRPARSDVPPKRPGPRKRDGSAGKDGAPTGALRIGLLIVGSFLVAFGAVRLLGLSRRATPVPAVKVKPAASAAPAPGAAAPASSATAGAPAGAATVETVDTALPPGIVLAADKGLLEVETAGAEAIYVDGVFVGRGPLRRIPLSPGAHEVRTKLNGRQRVDQVQIVKGRRTRLPLQALLK
jgi:DNA-binding response OmpR family regulator